MRTRTQDNLERLIRNWKGKPTWWHEVLYVLVFYAIYTFIRNLHGSNLSITTANRHALDIVALEKWLHIFNEADWQRFFLPHYGAIKFFNVWYGTAHFVVTIGVLLWLYHTKTDRYRKWRNVIFCTTFFALIGYFLYPLAPPRLLPAHFGFVDTLDTIGGLWNFDDGPAAKVSNQYAAMPSLHVGWSTWCAVAVIPTLKHWYSKFAIAIYPLITITTIVVTANHYWADVAGGLIVLTLGYGLAQIIDKRRRQAYKVKIEHARALARRTKTKSTAN